MRIKVLLVLSLCLTADLSSAEALDPAVTAVHGPQPRLVTPAGKIGAPPSDAILLLQGDALEEWERVGGGEPEWEMVNGVATVVPGSANIQTKRVFNDVQLHVEWRAPAPEQHAENLKSDRAQKIRDAVETRLGMDQYMLNSGVFLQQRYEVQVLEGYGMKTYVNGQAGAVYKQHVPLVTASRAPGEWQVYDIIFQAPRFGKDNALVVPARMTVFHNGVLIQNNVNLWGPTEFRGLPTYEAHGAAPLVLQSHAAVSQVSYRNIWVREL